MRRTKKTCAQFAMKTIKKMKKLKLLDVSIGFTGTVSTNGLRANHRILGLDEILLVQSADIKSLNEISQH